MRWVKIFESQEEAVLKLPLNQPLEKMVENRSLCFVRTEQRIFVILDRCSHNGERLSKGRLNAFGEIICPWHGYRFQLATGRECGERSRDVETFPIREAADGIYVGM